MQFKKYKIREQVFTFSPGYIITDETDQVIAEVKKHLFSISKKATFFDNEGNEKFVIRKKPFSFRPTYFIDKDGKYYFRIFKTFGFKTKIFVESLTDSYAFMIQGNLWRSEYAFYKDGLEFAYVSRNIWKLPDSYGAAISEDEDQELILSLVVVIDLIKDSRRRKS